MVSRPKSRQTIPHTFSKMAHRRCLRRAERSALIALAMMTKPKTIARIVSMIFSLCFPGLAADAGPIRRIHPWGRQLDRYGDGGGQEKAPWNLPWYQHGHQYADRRGKQTETSLTQGIDLLPPPKRDEERGKVSQKRRNHRSAIGGVHSPRDRQFEHIEHFTICEADHQ